MSLPPYTPLSGKIETYFKKFQEVGLPDKVNREWLKKIGFGSGNDYYIIRVLKYIGFIDDSNIPTELWKKYKNPELSKKILAFAIRTGYSELFNMYPDAYRKDREAIYAFFSITGKSEKTINMMVSTFQNLCKLADFEAEQPPQLEEQKKEEEMEEPVMERVVHHRGIRELHINIQLVLPETTDISVYDRLFESLKRHLLSDEE